MTASFAALVIALPVLLSPPPAQAAFREIEMVDDEFRPPEIIVQRGDTVVWIHRGVRPHGVRATDGSFDSSPGCSFQNGSSCMRSGDRYSRTFDQVGTFSYYCPVHGSANGVGMAGQITVASGSGGGGTTPPPPSPTTTTTRATTTVQPPTTGGTTTQSPGVSTTPPPPGSPTTATPPSPEPAEASPTPTPTPAPPVDATTTSMLASPTSLDADTDGANMLILVAALIVLAAAVSATAWNYRPGARRPGDPPGPTAAP